MSYSGNEKYRGNCNGFYALLLTFNLRRVSEIGTIVRIYYAFGLIYKKWKLRISFRYIGIWGDGMM
jgi:hypothetical protein